VKETVKKKKTKPPQETELTTRDGARIFMEATAGVAPSFLSPEALEYRAELEQELDKMEAQGIALDVSSDYLDLAEGFQPAYPDGSQPLQLPSEGLTLRKIRGHLTPDERLWLAQMIAAHGEKAVLERWPSYQMQINYVRNL
jgi:hypothetical protein